MSIEAVEATLTLPTVVEYLERMGVQYRMDELFGTPIVRSGWRFEVGHAALVISVSDSAHHTTRLEITCATHQRYPGQSDAVLQLLNTRNRERAFARSVDEDGVVYVEYVGFYPTGCPFPLSVFEVVFGGILLQFEEDYQAIEAVRLAEN
jgi:hypothetical protein